MIKYLLALLPFCAIAQSRLAEVEIIREWSVRKDINVKPGMSYQHILGDDTARYFHPADGKKIRVKYIFEDITPLPPPPPATVYTDSVDDRNARVKYSAGWIAYTGNTYHKKTAQYNSAAGASFSFTFTGHKIQWYAERRFNHGEARVDIFNTAGKRVKADTVNLYNARTNNASELIYQDTIKQGTYTMTVTMVVKENINDYIVVQSYTPIVGSNDPGPTPAPIPIPPIENSINVYPGSNVKQVIETASAGKTIILNQGTYVLQPVYIPTGVNILCKSALIQAAAAGYEASGIKAGVLNLSSGSRVNGNQYVKGCAIDGRNVGYSAIMVNNRDNVTIEGHTISDFNFNGVWISNSSGSKVLGNTFGNTSWSDPRYLSGALNIAGVTNMVIQHNKFTSNKNSKGTGIEALWKNTTLTNVKILNNVFDLSHHNPWNGGTSKNFSMELHDTYYKGLEIAYNEFQNEMSLASHKPGDGTKTVIHHNTGNLEGDTYFIETVADDFEVYDNTISNAQMFAVNFQKNSVWKNWTFRNNKLLSPAAMPSWGGAILIGGLGVQNVLLENNSLPSPIVRFMDPSKATGVTIR
jgi:parallel beta-helix repeat protein